MYISEANININKQLYTRNANGKKTSRIDHSINEQNLKKDVVSLSDDSKDMQLSKYSTQAGKIETTPEQLAERQDKIQRLKLAVNDGSYKINAEEIAERIIAFSI